jgi:alpha-L-fucosidase
MDGGYSLTPWNIDNSGIALKTVNKQRRGTVPPYAAIEEPVALKWKIYIDRPEPKTFDISYSYQGGSDKGAIRIKAARETISHEVSSSGKTVAEPDSDWVIDEFRSHRAGIINFEKSGYYYIEMEINPQDREEIKFQWLWIR